MTDGTMTPTVDRLRAEFLEMPGLRVTVEQVQRLCGIGGHACQSVLDTLVAGKFLRANDDGTYARLTEGHSGTSVADSDH